MRRSVFGALLALGILAAAPVPARADEPKRNTIYVKPADMAAAQAAREKGVVARKLLKDGKHAEGVKMLDEAVGEFERTMGPDSDYARVNREAAIQVYKALKQPDKAEAMEKRAEAARKTWKGTSPEPANANTAAAMQKMQLGLTALKANDFTKAAEYLEQALPDVAKSDASGKMYLLISGVLASLYDYSQQFAKGEALRKDVIAKLEKMTGEDSPDVAEQYESLATHYIMRADTPKAIAAQKKSVELTRKKQPGTMVLADRELALTNLLMETGDYAAAAPALREAMGIISNAPSPDPLRMVRILGVAVSLADATLDFKRGDEAADSLCKLAQASGKPEVLEEAETDCIRAAIAKGDTKAAGVLAGARFSRVEKRHGTSGPFFAHAAHELALVRWVEGKKDEATGLAKRGADAQEKHLVRLLNASGDTQKRAQISMLSAQGYDLLSMGGAGNGGGSAQTRLALETILRRKGRSLDASADAARLVRLFQGGAERSLASRQVEVRRQIAALGLRGAGGGGGGLVDPTAMLAKLEAEDDDISNKLAAASPLYRAQTQPVTIEAVQAAIPDDAALVEYVYYVPRDTTSARFAPKGVSFAAFVLHKTGEPVAVDLGDALPIGVAVDELRKSLSSRGDVLPNAKRVHDLVVAPLKKHLKSSDTRLLVSPDEDLNLVPYAALVDERGRFLVQDYEISYLTSGRDLLRIAAGSSKAGGTSKPVVLGNPSFDGTGAGSGSTDARLADAKTTRGDLDNARFPALPGTAVEVKAISEILAAYAFTEAEATKAKLSGVTSPVVLHVATHGFFLTKQKDPAGTNTRSLEYDPGSPVTLPQRTENPLVRSGLALAGANKKGSADGLLTALEASSMSLDGTRLVVLSACETGVGQTEVGDGVYGLRRALVVAGSETQVMSLWKVDDDATRDLMIAYYKDLKGGAGRSAALRKVQLGMIANKPTQHPYFWAAFIPSGAWGPMAFNVEGPLPGSSGSSTSTPPAKDRPSESRSDDEGYIRKGSMGSVSLGAHYINLTNLRDQPDRTGIMLGLTVEHALLGEAIPRRNGFAVHDGIILAAYGGARTSDGTKYLDAEEGSFSAGFKTAYELAFGVRANAVSFVAGMQASYTSYIIGDARTFGLTTPVIGLLDFRLGSTFIGLRGSYGKFLVDQETVGGALSLSWDDVFLAGGVEQLKMPATVSADGIDDRTTAGNQVSTMSSVQIGGRF